MIINRRECLPELTQSQGAHCVSSSVAFRLNSHTVRSFSSFGISEASSKPIKYSVNFIDGKSNFFSNLQLELMHRRKRYSTLECTIWNMKITISFQLTNGFVCEIEWNGY